MKDEEMAEEIANKRCHEIMCYGHCSFNSPKHHRCGEWYREYNCALAGLKAGRLQWHDLRKNPNDLPKEGTKVISEKGDFVFLQDKRWKEFSPNWDNIPLRKWEEPIAWCEIPTFDKE